MIRRAAWRKHETDRQDRPTAGIREGWASISPTPSASTFVGERFGWSAGLAGPSLRRHWRRCGWHQRRQSRLTAQDLQLLRLTLCLLRRLLRLLSFLRHTALLAMMRWRYRNSAVANRHALRSDYYSTTKKTANPLNEWWTKMERRDARSARRFTHRCARRACGRFHRAIIAQFLLN